MRRDFVAGGHFEVDGVVARRCHRIARENGAHEPLTGEMAGWRGESPTDKYALYFAIYAAVSTEEWTEAKSLLAEADGIMPEEPLIFRMRGVISALSREDRDGAAVYESRVRESKIIRACASHVLSDCVHSGTAGTAGRRV